MVAWIGSVSFAEISIPLCQAGYDHLSGYGHVVAEALIASKKERAVLANRSADGSSKIVLINGKFSQPPFIGEKVVCVEALVAPIFPCRTMEFIRSTLAHHAYN